MEVIPMISRAYRATRVNDVDWDRLARGNEGVGVALGIDVGKRDLWAVCRWQTAQFERPWRVKNPEEIPTLVALIQRISAGRELVVAMESSGTYGDALRQALADGKVAVSRVSNKAAHDYAEIFDGVPSQHDGKDAAVIAELAALGKAQPWGYVPPSEWDQELTYWVEWMVAQRQILTNWQGRLEALVSRHWPEATRVLKLSSVTLLRALEHYGDPASLAADPNAAEQLARWGGQFLSSEKAERLVEEARSSVGMRAGEWRRQQIKEYAREALTARQRVKEAERRLRALAAGNPVLEAQGAVVGIPTACVLWASTGDPRDYHAAAAYRKAMGLNLKERSSGAYQGQLRISKRGSARSRQWLYFAALRLVQRGGVRPWYEAKKARKGDDARKVVVAVMRKLVVALYHVGVKGEAFEPRRLFASIGRRGAQGASKG
ncbi:MAG: transposase [Candidatus Dormibacteria bacterium]